MEDEQEYSPFSILRGRRAGIFTLLPMSRNVPTTHSSVFRMMEFLDISDILLFEVDIADPLFGNSMIVVKHMG